MHNKGNTPSIDIIDEALKKHKLYELFVGEYYQAVSPYGTVPTDSIFIFDSWIDYVNFHGNSDKLWKLFQDTILQISIDKDYSWFSAYYLNKFLNYCKRNNLSVLNNQELIDKIINNVLQHKEQLSLDYRWAGEQTYSFSLWSDFVRLIKIMNEDLGYNFHLEKLG